MEKDIVVDKNTLTLTLKGRWLEYLKDFGLEQEDFNNLSERITRASLDIVFDIIKSKHSLK